MVYVKVSLVPGGYLGVDEGESVPSEFVLFHEYEQVNEHGGVPLLDGFSPFTDTHNVAQSKVWVGLRTSHARQGTHRVVVFLRPEWKDAQHKSSRNVVANVAGGSVPLDIRAIVHGQTVDRVRRVEAVAPSGEARRRVIASAVDTKAIFNSVISVGNNRKWLVPNALCHKADGKCATQVHSHFASATGMKITRSIGEAQTVKQKRTC